MLIFIHVQGSILGEPHANWRIQSEIDPFNPLASPQLTYSCYVESVMGLTDLSNIL